MHIKSQVCEYYFKKKDARLQRTVSTDHDKPGLRQEAKWTLPEGLCHHLARWFSNLVPRNLQAALPYHTMCFHIMALTEGWHLKWGFYLKTTG